MRSQTAILRQYQLLEFKFLLKEVTVNKSRKFESFYATTTRFSIAGHAIKEYRLSSLQPIHSHTGIPPRIYAANVHSRPARQECVTYTHGPTQIHLNRWSIFAFIFNMQDFFKSVTLFAKYFSKYFFFFLAALRKSVFPAAGSRHIAFDIVLSRRAARNIRTKSLQI